MSEASDLIAVSYDVTGKPFYNGYETVHEALWNLEEDFRLLPFADRMLFSVELLSDLESPKTSTRFWYTINDDGNETICSVYAQEDMINPMLEWRWDELYAAGIMSSMYDVRGLYQYLVGMGELLPNDSLTFFH